MGSVSRFSSPASNLNLYTYLQVFRSRNKRSSADLKSKGSLDFISLRFFH